MPELSCRDAIHAVLAAEMRANPKLLLFATAARPEDALAAPAMEKRFGRERVRIMAAGADTVAGAALGAARMGFRSVLELHSPEDVLAALPVLAGQAANARYTSGGQQNAALVVRAETGGLGPALETWFAHLPGLLVAAPSTPYDAAGLLRGALRDGDNPTVFLESARLAAVRGETPEAEFTLPFGAASVRREGRDVTVVSYGWLSGVALAACEHAAAEDAIDAEMLDLRTLTPLDVGAVLASVKKTGRLLLCSPAPRTANVLNEIAVGVNEHAFDDLDAPVRRVCALDTPLPASPELQNDVLPTQAKIEDAIRSLMKE